MKRKNSAFDEKLEVVELFFCKSVPKSFLAEAVFRGKPRNLMKP